MNAPRKLAPHDAELVEADARALWEAMETTYGKKPAWEDLNDAERAPILAAASDPYRYF